MASKRLEEIRKKLAEQTEAEKDAREEQEATDLEALHDAKMEHGTAAVVAVVIPWTPGLPTFAVFRRPRPLEFKRFQDQITQKDATPADTVEAAELLSGLCRVYPPEEAFAKMVAVAPGLPVAGGSAAVGLASGKAKEDRKS
jgi:hypothetical protein